MLFDPLFLLLLENSKHLLSQKLLKESQSSILLFKFQSSSLQNSIYKLHFFNPVSLFLYIYIYICISTNWMPSVLDSHWFQVRLLNFFPIIFNVIYIYFSRFNSGFLFLFLNDIWFLEIGTLVKYFYSYYYLVPSTSYQI